MKTTTKEFDYQAKFRDAVRKVNQGIIPSVVVADKPVVLPMTNFSIKFVRLDSGVAKTVAFGLTKCQALVAVAAMKPKKIMVDGEMVLQRVVMHEEI